MNIYILILMIDNPGSPMAYIVTSGAIYTGVPVRVDLKLSGSSNIADTPKSASLHKPKDYHGYQGYHKNEYTYS